ncbi:MAG: PAS domain S-box protein [Undibacterium sp.]|nr:PAS domain S-box protein [Undibacterium sp.]
MSSAHRPLAQGILRHILQHAKDAIMVVSAPELILLEVNLRTCEMIGCQREELLGQPLFSVECALQDIFFWEELNELSELTTARITESEWLTHRGEAVPIEKKVYGYTENEQRYWIIQAEDLTHRRRIMSDQVHLASQLQSSLEATAEGVLSVDLQGVVINLNRRFTAMWSLTDETIVAKREGELMRQLLACLRHPAAFAEVLERVKNEPESETENTLELLDGRHFVCISKPEFLRDHVVGRVFSVRDISAMKQVENDLVDALTVAEQAVTEKTQMLDALELSESRLQRLINSSIIGIFQGDMSGHLTVANDVFLALLGVRREEIIGDQVEWLKFTSSTYFKAHQEAILELQEFGQAAPFQSELTKHDGTKVPVMVGLARLEGSSFEWVGFVLDLTEQKKADQVKAEFISVVSHELRTPLTSIRGALGLLESGAAGELTPKLMHLIKIAHRNSQRLGTLVNDLLDMEKLASGKMPFKSVRFDLVMITRHSMEANANFAAEYGVRYSLDAPESALFAIGDSDRVMQVLANLLSNAAKFSPRGEDVRIRVTDHGQMARVEVEDHGPGIPLEFRSRIFTKFAQADGSDTRQQGGTGLGLNIAKSFAEKMGGELGFESEVGKGSTFWFTLPIAAV